MYSFIDARPKGRRRLMTTGFLSVYAILVLSAGCSDRLPAKQIYGTVTYQGQKVDAGNVRFVPIEGTEGPASRAYIIDGQYRIDARGGVPLGKHRVEVNAQRKTGRKVMGRTAADVGQVDEMVTVGPPKYTGTDSTIIVEVKKDLNGQFDIDIPAQ
jgi:hypothetical protein